MKIELLIFLLLSCSFAISIESYDSRAQVLENGDINVYETITFELEKQYNEGFRSIRSEDAPSTEYLDIHSVEVNGFEADFYKQVYDGDVEIVWTETYSGTNKVELNYTLKDRTEIFDDFARVCFEHFGANWDVPAKKFSSQMTLPEESLGKTMHFEIYSSKKGDAFVDEAAIKVEMDDVPPGNYIGGCYLFDKDSVESLRIVNGSAYEILTDERKSYDSVEVMGPSTGWECICLPIFIISAIISAYLYVKRRRKRYPESILPPEEESPAVVAALLKNEKPEKNLLAATILDLINRKFIDIVELEKKGEKSTSIKRERTILFLKKKDGLKPHELSVIKMIFNDKKEVDLDKLAADFKEISSKAIAKSHYIPAAFSNFQTQLDEILIKSSLHDSVIGRNNRVGISIFVSVFIIFIIFGCFGIDIIFDMLYYFDIGIINQILLQLVVMGAAVILIAFSIWKFIEPCPPDGMEEKFARWDAFARGLKSSRIKEYPPSSVQIWGRILVYATALGMADKVKKHLSELDDLTLKYVEEMEEVSRSTGLVYVSAIGLNNLSKYGNRSGYSSRSSGGWSSSGGGGFSGGSSGGGGFR